MVNVLQILGDRIICMNKEAWIAAVAFLAHVTAAILRVGSAGGMDFSRYMIRSHMGSGALGMHSSRSAAIALSYLNPHISNMACTSVPF